MVNDRVGLHLDVRLEGVEPRDIGWESDTDTVFFNFSLDREDAETPTFDPTLTEPFEE